MKTTSQNKYGSGLPDDLGSVIAREHEQVKKELRIKAVQFAKQNRPDLQGDSLYNYVGEFIARYEKIISQTIAKIQPELAIQQAKALTEESGERIKMLEEKKQQALVALENQELTMEQDGIALDELNNFRPKNTNDAIPYLIVIGETAFNISAFQLLGSDWASSLVISASISLALFWLAKQLAKFLKQDTADSRKKKLITIGTTILALGVFYLLAILRSKQLEENDSFQVHPVFLVFINVLFYVITLWHFYRKTQTPEELKKYEELKQLREKQEEFKREIEQAENEIGRIKNETKEQLQELLQKPVLCKWLVDLIQRYKQESIEIFKSQNMLFRKDRKTPDCFREGVPGYFLNS